MLAIRKLGEFQDPAAEDLLARCVKSPDWRVALLAVLALAPHPSPDVLTALDAAWNHPERPRRYPLAHAIVTTIADLRTSEAVELTIGRLPQLDGQLRYEAIARLTRSSGKTFGLDLTAWSD